MFALPVALAVAAIGLAAQPVKWEYAELSYQPVRGRLAGTDPDGKAVEAVPASVALRWTTGADETTYKGWDKMAEGLKATPKKDGSAALHRLQVLNALGADGWELVSQTAGVQAAVRTAADRGKGGGFGNPAPVPVTTGTTLLFKRRVP